MLCDALNRHLENGSHGLAHGAIDRFLRPAANERLSVSSPGAYRIGRELGIDFSTRNDTKSRKQNI